MLPNSSPEQKGIVIFDDTHLVELPKDSVPIEDQAAPVLEKGVAVPCSEWF